MCISKKKFGAISFGHKVTLPGEQGHPFSFCILKYIPPNFKVFKIYVENMVSRFSRTDVLNSMAHLFFHI